MTSDVRQTFRTHRRFVPMYHFVASLLLLVNAGYALWTLIRAFSFGAIVQVTTAFALLLLFYYLRVFPLAVQDRVIRLEERLRLARLLPDDLKGRTGEFTPGQLIGLRFASDVELPALARRVLDDGMSSREAIKREITDWRPDACRA